MEQGEVFENYWEAIAFFQKYPDQWKALLDGIIAKRNAKIPEANTKLLDCAAVERGSLAIGILAHMGALDEVLREMSVDRSVVEEPDEEPEG